MPWRNPCRDALAPNISLGAALGYAGAPHDGRQIRDRNFISAALLKLAARRRVAVCTTLGVHLFPGES